MNYKNIIDQLNNINQNSIINYLSDYLFTQVKDKEDIDVNEILLNILIEANIDWYENDNGPIIDKIIDGCKIKIMDSYSEELAINSKED